MPPPPHHRFAEAVVAAAAAAAVAAVAAAAAAAAFEVRCFVVLVPVLLPAAVVPAGRVGAPSSSAAARLSYWCETR